MKRTFNWRKNEEFWKIIMIWVSVFWREVKRLLLNLDANGRITNLSVPLFLLLLIQYYLPHSYLTVSRLDTFLPAGEFIVEVHYLRRKERFVSSIFFSFFLTVFVFVTFISRYFMWLVSVCKVYFLIFIYIHWLCFFFSFFLQCFFFFNIVCNFNFNISSIMTFDIQKIQTYIYPSFDKQKQKQKNKYK